MKTTYKQLTWFCAIISVVIIFSSFYSNRESSKNTFLFPYKQAGLNERQAAAHLLSRFTYGATPGEIDEVVKIGLEKWFQNQLSGDLPDDSLNLVLSSFDALALSNKEVAAKYPNQGQILRMVVKDGTVDKDSVKKDGKVYRDVLQQYMQNNGLKPRQDLYRQFISQKVLRAAYSKNQLQEVMTSFWFNHFNVSITKNDCAAFIPAYERDVIRPNAMGKFSNLLVATAQSPAMLYFLDNFSSVGTKVTSGSTMSMAKMRKPKSARGLNENYAREVMELHTLGVDGGYTQLDVTEAARVLTGWTVYPMGVDTNPIERPGFVHEGDFLFTPNRHDNSVKTVLGASFGPDGGYQEGQQLLNMLAHHSSTAKFISGKIAIRFVSDHPSEKLIDKMAQVFRDKDGDIKQVLIAMVTTSEFWSATSVREKTKSPFELAIGAVRSVHADIKQPYQLFNWISRMGEKMYYYQAPTGFPDKGQYWINTGALLNRMNFGLALASGRIPGVRVDLIALNNHHEPESAQAALRIYSQLIMPDRDLAATIKRLTPMLNDPELIKKVDVASAKVSAPQADMDQDEVKTKVLGNSTMLAQVVGVILGSPEYQRR
ncbi:: hypothetical protein [Arcticibacter svalbardensis MN12-7]|uniref:Uncharacterized protein n=1 Tax=Arcticibacter svalbardensis MN12-7 TaxID=1150600 RepID=R9GU49_9SPHI|nr:DUF1800 domain-containing protein [Arcticibacter svalbardensis]EOR95060.1 : hypothetical protein [Arcticibacter svalbardensis MN12-7]